MDNLRSELEALRERAATTLQRHPDADRLADLIVRADRLAANPSSQAEALEAVQQVKAEIDRMEGSPMRGTGAEAFEGVGDGLRLAKAKAPSTVARCVIHFGPESHCQGSGSLVLRGGGVVENGRCVPGCAHPHLKIRYRFREYKHTSLIFLVGEFCELRLYAVLRSSPHIHSEFIASC